MKNESIYTMNDHIDIVRRISQPLGWFFQQSENFPGKAL